jgi:hypothetical protein
VKCHQHVTERSHAQRQPSVNLNGSGQLIRPLLLLIALAWNLLCLQGVGLNEPSVPVLAHMEIECSVVSSMRNAGTIELFRYWNHIRDGQPAPKRTQIEPIDIRTYLADTFILEQGLRREVTFRLAGTRVCAIYGRELKDYSFFGLFSLGDMGLAKRLINACFLDKTVSVIGFDGITKSKKVAAFEGIFMPLAGPGESERIFGAIFSDSKPFWLGAEPVAESRITSVRIIDPDKELVLNNRPSVAVPPIRPGFHNLERRKLTETNSTQTIRQVGHLTVITGGRSEEE